MSSCYYIISRINQEEVVMENEREAYVPPVLTALGDIRSKMLGGCAGHQENEQEKVPVVLVQN